MALCRFEPLINKYMYMFSWACDRATSFLYLVHLLEKENLKVRSIPVHHMITNQKEREFVLTTHLMSLLIQDQTNHVTHHMTQCHLIPIDHVIKD